MTYLYTLLSITAWVATIALSSSALVSYENGKQVEAIKATITRTTAQVVAKKEATAPIVQVVSETQQVVSEPEVKPDSQVVSQPATIKPVVAKPITVKAPVIQKPVQNYEDDEEDDN
jgi:hypothetical protein